MIVAAAVCPAAPWLVPGVAPRLAERAAAIGSAAIAAVATLADVDRVVVVVPAPPGRTKGRQAGCATDEDHWAEPSTPLDGTLLPPGGGRVGVCRSDRGPGPTVPVTRAVAAALLRQAGIDHPTTVVTVSDRSPGPPDGADDPAARIGLLVLADGAAAHGPAAPGRQDARSAGLDRRIAVALAAGRPDRLAAATEPTADPPPADLLARVDGLRALAAWTAHRPPRRASLSASAAPFGVGYLVATWQWTAEPVHAGQP